MRHGGEAALDLAGLATILADDVDDFDRVRSMLGDPIVIDLASSPSSRWFEHLRGRWCRCFPMMRRSSPRAGCSSTGRCTRSKQRGRATAVVVRDLRTGEHLDVRERTMSAQATVGQMVCARALPDSVTNQFVGSVFHVPPGA